MQLNTTDIEKKQRNKGPFLWKNGAVFKYNVELLYLICY